MARPHLLETSFSTFEHLFVTISLGFSISAVFSLARSLVGFPSQFFSGVLKIRDEGPE